MHQLVVPVVAALLSSATAIGAPRWRCTTTTFLMDGVSAQGLVGHLLERHDVAAAIAAVGGHEQRRTASR